MSSVHWGYSELLQLHAYAVWGLYTQFLLESGIWRWVGKWDTSQGQFNSSFCGGSMRETSWYLKKGKEKPLVIETCKGALRTSKRSPFTSSPCISLWPTAVHAAPHRGRSDGDLGYTAWGLPKCSQSSQRGPSTEKNKIKMHIQL